MPAYQLEQRYLSPDGDDINVLLNVWLATDNRGEPLYLDEDGRPQYIIRQLQDITKRKAAEAALATTNRELQRSNAELDQFASVASHDLAAPLTAISGFASLLERRYAAELDDTAREYIGFVTAGATRMKTLIDDLLRYSRVGSRAKPFQAVDCNQIINQVIDALRMNIENTDASVDVADLPEVQADEVQLSQVMQNLVGNALKFVTPGDRAVVRIGATRGRDEWTFSVEDNGIGIAPESRERVFQMFQRLLPPDDYPGNGIGLAICAKIIDRHGGRLWVEDPVELKGSRFVFTIPDRPPAGG
jgi:light-regulated signal transduction histidine kinase (bacteriophytochrome)